MKKTTQTKILGGIGIALAAVVLAGCTQNFCTDKDRAYMAYPYDQGVTVYCNKDELPEAYQSIAKPALEGNETIYAYIPVDSAGNYAAKKANYLVNTIIANARNNGIVVPSLWYFAKIDQRLLTEAYSEYSKLEGAKPLAELRAEDLNPFKVAEGAPEGTQAYDVKGTETGIEDNYESILRDFGHLKFEMNTSKEKQKWASDDCWSLHRWVEDLRKEEDVKIEIPLYDEQGQPTGEYEEKLVPARDLCPSQDFMKSYQTTIATNINNRRSCIATLPAKDGKARRYGHYGEDKNWVVPMETTTYKGAWKKGFLEGLIIYPVAALTDLIAGKIDPNLTGYGQIVSIIIVTIIVRLVLLLATFKSTLNQQKMQALQPQLAKIQQKYPNSQTNAAERQRLQQEQAALYKRNKINPLGSLLVMIVQFPVFISVWGAFQGSAALSTGSVLNLSLSETIREALFNVKGAWYTNINGWWTALVLFILMAGFQFLAMMLPQWLNKRRLKSVQKLTANAAQDKNTRTSKMISYGMLIFTIIMGFMLPSAMGVYWAIGALVSMSQTLITQKIISSKDRNKERR